jgi:hypothetical protein
MNGRKRPMNDHAIDRIEHEIGKMEQKVTQLYGSLQHFEEGSWDYERVKNEICKIERNIRKESRKLDAICV